MALLGVIQPVVDGSCQVFRVTRREETSAVQSKLRRGGDRAVGNDRHQACGERLDAGDRLALHVRGMHVQIGGQEVFYQFIAVDIDKLRLVFEVLAEFHIFVVLGSASGENQLNTVGVPAVLHGVDDHVLPLLLTQPPNHHNLEAPLCTLYLVPLYIHERVLNAVGDGMDLGGIVAGGNHVPHKNRRYVHVTHAIVNTPTERAVEEFVEPFDLSHADRGSHVLGLDMEGGCHGFADGVTIIDCLHGDTKRNKNMHYIRPVASGVNNVLIRICEAEIVLVAERLEDGM